MKKECKVVMLPTDKAENAAIMQFGKLKNFTHQYFTKEYLNSIGSSAHHLYIVSDDPIKAGDWCLCDDRMTVDDKPEYFIGQCKSITNGWINVIEGQSENPNWTKKIIATTDINIKIGQELNDVHSRGLSYFPSISQDFINLFIAEYNKGSIITNVMVEYHESHMEELSDILKVNPDNTIVIHVPKTTWTREDVVELCKKAYYDASPMMQFKKTTLENANQWIEDNL